MSRAKQKYFRLRRLICVGAMGIVGILIGLLWHSSVDNRLTTEDTAVIREVLAAHGVSEQRPKSFAEEISVIEGVQDAVLSVAPIHKTIPAGSSREPKDLVKLGYGFCHDRSRLIEKSLRHLGFEARHIFLYTRSSEGFLNRDIFIPGIPSHAITEVKTAKGWVVIDSNVRWISLGYDGNPISMKTLSEGGSATELREPFPFSIYERPIGYIYGLYSRHGKFFPPYNAVPDINYGELVENF